MKNNIATIFLSIGLIVLYILHFTSNSTNNASDADSIASDSLVADSSKIDSSAILVNLGDSTFLDSLEIASYSKVGYLSIEQVVFMCPSLKKDQDKIVGIQKSIGTREMSLKTNLQNYLVKKQEEGKELYEKGLLTQAGQQRLQEEAAQKQMEAEEKMKSLAKEFQVAKEMEAKFAQKLDDVIGQGLKIINEKLQLDYILIEKRELSTVYALNEKNNITELMIKIINSQN
tara:strand:+ start:1097 stop:1786 length:690 start_codon:yes stop_codon:yes gene_type:complete